MGTVYKLRRFERRYASYRTVGSQALYISLVLGIPRCWLLFCGACHCAAITTYMTHKYSVLFGLGANVKRASD